MYYVYAHYRKTDDLIFYVGVAKSKKRFLSKYSRNNFWKNIVEKHGFYYKILIESDIWEECLNEEIKLIKHYGRIDLKTGVLCNMTDGGEGCFNLSSESKDKISHKLKGLKRDSEYVEKVRLRMKGKKLSDETKSKISKKHKQVDKSYLIGRELSDETKKRISESKKGKSIGVGKILSKEHKKAISNGFKPKFSDEEIEDMILLYNSGESLRNIATRFNSNHSTIKKYITKNYDRQ
jgi:hypothetical protein